MHLSSRKLKLIIVIITTLILFLISILILINYNNNQKFKTFSNKIEKQSSYYKNEFPNEHVLKNLYVLENSKLPNTEKYQALTQIVFYFKNVYFEINSPEIRNFAIEIDKFASENFKDEYNKFDFIIQCTDEECGEKITPEIKAFIIEIENLDIDPVYKKSILYNIRNGALTPNDNFYDRQDKQISFGLAVNTLNSLENPQASSTAKKIKDYFDNNYRNKK